MGALTLCSPKTPHHQVHKIKQKWKAQTLSLPCFFCVFQFSFFSNLLCFLSAIILLASLGIPFFLPHWYPKRQNQKKSKVLDFFFSFTNKVVYQYGRHYPFPIKRLDMLPCFHHSFAFKFFKPFIGTTNPRIHMLNSMCYCKLKFILQTKKSINIIHIYIKIYNFVNICFVYNIILSYLDSIM